MRGSKKGALAFTRIETGIVSGNGGTNAESEIQKIVTESYHRAREFGGGGHAKASGALIAGELSEVRDRVVERAKEFLAQDGSVTV